jgi:pimeloyl-ACP methyl ester carboxylesterase
MASRRVDIGGRAVAVTDEGDRPPLLLLHGFPLDRHVWRPQVDAFRETRRVLAPDLVGFGDSSPAGRLSVDEHADDMAGILDDAGVRRAVVVGLSMGGYVAFAMWRRHPERFAGLVLACTRAGPDTEAGRAGRYQMAVSAAESGMAGVADALLPRLLGGRATGDHAALVREMMVRQPTDGVVAALKAMAARPSSRPDLGTITVPVLVVTGADDGVIDPSESQAIADGVPGARLVTIRGAGHLVSLEEPGAFNAVLRSFLDSIEPS